MTATTAHQPDNLFGICHRIAEDFGFDPLWLRIGLALAFLLAPLPVVFAYFTLGLFVVASRALVPVRRPLAPGASLPVPVL